MASNRGSRRLTMVALVAVVPLMVAPTVLLVVVQHRESVFRQTLVRDLEWARVQLAPSARLAAMLDAAGAPALQLPSEPVGDPEVTAISETLFGSTRLRPMVQRIAATEGVARHRACVALATFATDFACSAGAGAITAASDLIADAEPHCGDGLGGASEVELASLRAASQRRVDTAAMRQRELAVRRAIEYRHLTDGKDAVLRADFPRPEGRMCGGEMSLLEMVLRPPLNLSDRPPNAHERAYRWWKRDDERSEYFAQRQRDLDEPQSLRDLERIDQRRAETLSRWLAGATTAAR